MKEFLLSERYKLILRWEKVVYEREGVCKLEGAYFSGPALSMAQKINDDDNINVDFCRQYLIFTNFVYVAKLSWGEVVYNKDGAVTLKNAVLSHDTELNRVPKFKDTDYIVINTENHEEAVHSFNLVYESYVVNENGDLYKF